MGDKPGWKDAPEWAEWLAQDEDGSWNWFEVRPGRTEYLPCNFWVSRGDTRSEEHCLGAILDLWSDTLERRHAHV